MSSQPLKAALLIVSTTAAQDPSADAANAALRDVFERDGGGQWAVVDSEIVADVVADIQYQIMLWTDKPDTAVDLIVTTGGTGFAPSDQTPEAVEPLLSKKAPGLVHGMLAASLQVTPFAMMSRPVAGVRGRTVIITLPGSPKGARENLQAVLKTLPHACLQVSGQNSRKLHAGGVKKLEQEAGVAPSAPPAAAATAAASQKSHHHHGCGHSHSGHNHGGLVRHTKPDDGLSPRSNDPNLGPSRRHRESPYPMLSVQTALDQIALHTPAPTVTVSKVDSGLVGAVLAQDVTAAENVPAFRASIVDGYAVVVPPSGDMRGVYPVTSVSHAAPSNNDTPGAATLKPGEVARITTGAPLPPGATSVIMVEDTILASVTPDSLEEHEVEILATGVKEGENIREVGSDIAQGTTILREGEQVTAVGGELGLLAAVGVAEVRTYRRPVVGVLSTGDELVDDGSPLGHGQVRDTNRPTLMAAARGLGYEVVDLGIASDRPGTLEDTLRLALRAADLVITTGGVSMGELDLLKPTVERALGGSIHFGRVAMKPGKPTTFATVPVKDNDGNRVTKAIFSLPGNPASALVTFHLFVLPALNIMSGIDPPCGARLPVRLAHEFPLDRARPEYHRAVVSVGKDGTLVAVSTGGQRSSRVGSMKGANALLALPSGDEPLPAGAWAEALMMGPVAAALPSTYLPS